MELTLVEKNNWENEIYTVRKRHFDDTYFWLTVVRKDGQPMRSWSDLQDIKNTIVGPNHEGFEIFPAEDRLVDERNAYHLWVFRDGQIRIDTGLKYRRVSK